jgi:hypothetical protein
MDGRRRERRKRPRNLDINILRRKKKGKELNQSTISFTSLPSNFLHHPSNREPLEKRSARQRAEKKEQNLQGK